MREPTFARPLRRRLLSLALAGGVLAASALPGLTVQPDEVLADPALEGRARQLSLQLRCMVCQNQSIDDSDAELARDLRVLVRERLKAGDSDEEVIDYLVDRYGEFVLLKPRVSARNFILWGTPVAVLVIGGIGFFAYARRQRPQKRAEAELTPEEKARLEQLLSEGR